MGTKYGKAQSSPLPPMTKPSQPELKKVFYASTIRMNTANIATVYGQEVVYPSSGGPQSQWCFAGLRSLLKSRDRRCPGRDSGCTETSHWNSSMILDLYR